MSYIWLVTWYQTKLSSNFMAPSKICLLCFLTWIECMIFWDSIENFYWSLDLKCSNLTEVCDIKAHLCKPVGIGVLQSFQDITREDCKRQCQQNQNCTFATYTKFREEPKCFLMSSCDSKVKHICERYDLLLTTL